MAAKYLAIQGSSVPCEREFSSAGLVDTKRCNKLSSERFGNIEYVKAYYHQEREYRGNDAEVELDLKRKRTEDEAQDSKAETAEKRARTMPEI